MLAANQTLRKRFESEIKSQKLEVALFVPDKKLCTDNAAMIAAAAFFNNLKIELEKGFRQPRTLFRLRNNSATIIV